MPIDLITANITQVREFPDPSTERTQFISEAYASNLDIHDMSIDLGTTTSGGFIQQMNTTITGINSTIDDINLKVNEIGNITNATLWVSGASYIQATTSVSASIVQSPMDNLQYKCILSHSGVSTDPSLDSARWQRVSGVLTSTIKVDINNNFVIGGNIASASVNGTPVYAKLGVFQDNLSTDYAVCGFGKASSVSATSGATVFLARARGSLASPTVVQNGDLIGSTISLGYDGASYRLGARIDTYISGSPSSSSMPTDIVFSTTPTGGIVPQEAMRIKSDKNIVFLGNISANNLFAHNYIINPNKLVNQSGLTSTDNSYNQDQWYKSGNNWYQPIEGYSISSGTYTLSWTGSATASYFVGTNGSSTINSQTFTSVSNGGNFTITIANNQYLWIKFASDATGASFDNVKLEKGTIATPFEKRHIGSELSLCQRYYERIGGTANGRQFFATGFIGATNTNFYGTFKYATKRVSPTISLSNGDIGVLAINFGNSDILVNTSNSVSFNSITPTSANLSTGLNGSSAPSNGGAYCSIFGNSGYYIDISARL